MNQVRGKVKTQQSKARFSRWFRFYEEALFDPKVQLLPGELFKHWVNCLCIASKNGGVIPAEGLPFMLHVTPVQSDAIVQELIRHGLLEWGMVRGDTCLTPHGWQQRQFACDASDPTVAERMKRYRKRSGRNANRNGKRNAGVTVTVFASESVSDSESHSPREGSIQEGGEGSYLTEKGTNATEVVK